MNQKLRKGSEYISNSKTINNYEYLLNGESKPTFFHKHKGGQLYHYPFRDLKQYLKKQKLVKFT